MNTVYQMGNLGQDPTITTFTSGAKKASFNLAVNESYKKKGETEWTKKTYWFTVEAWNISEYLQKNLKKGARIIVEGKLISEEYEKDGVKKKIVKIQASRLDLLQKVETAENSQEETQVEETTMGNQEQDDLPF